MCSYLVKCYPISTNECDNVSTLFNFTHPEKCISWYPELWNANYLGLILTFLNARENIFVMKLGAQVPGGTPVLRVSADVPPEKFCTLN